MHPSSGYSRPRPFSSTLYRKHIAMDVASIALASKIDKKQHTDSAPEFLTYNP
jgi:hypothetical protein